MLPGPRKTKSYDEELYDKWLAANYPIRSNTQLLFGDDFFDLREEPWGTTSKSLANQFVDFVAEQIKELL